MNNKDDERLRKTTIAFLKDFAEQGYENAVECIDWLEKQGEQKSIDMVEPKFKVGDWIITDKNHIWYVDEDCSTTGYLYRLVAINGKVEVAECEVVDKHARLWNIADAKEGDVVFYRGNVKYSDGIKYERICLFNNLNNAFFTLTKTSNYVEEYDIDVNIDYLDNTVPATKGQRDLLYVTMKEAGYEWSSEDRKLNKVEPKFKVGDWIIFYGLVTHIDEVVNGRYRTTPIDGIPCSYDWDIDNVVRLWNIADAKDGDVLASDNGVIILVKESRDSSWGYRLSYHCAVLYDGTFEHREFHVNPEKFFPATKEQRDQLEKAMVNARYKWNKKKRKLEKI